VTAFADEETTSETPSEEESETPSEETSEISSEETSETPSEETSEISNETPSESAVENELLAKFVSLVNELPEVTSDEYSNMSTDEKNELYSKTNDAWDIYDELVEQALSDYEQTVFLEASEKLGALAELFNVDIMPLDNDDDTPTIQSDHANHKICNGITYVTNADGVTHTAVNCDHSDITTWTELSATYIDEHGLPESGNYYLTTDVELSSDWKIDEEVNLCLNGHSITSENGYTIVNYNGILNLTDCQGGEDVKIVSVDNAGTFKMYGGNIAGNTSHPYGG
jgi:hypothetical protein